MGEDVKVEKFVLYRQNLSIYLNRMNPKQFLMVGGVVLVVVGLAGFFGLIGPTAESSLFGSGWWFDNTENWAHLVLGVAALAIAYTLGSSLQSLVTLLVGLLGVLVGLWSLLGSTNFYGAHLENPADTLLHLAVGAWALWAWWSAKKAAPMGM